jgi:hypothetical protein
VVGTAVYNLQGYNLGSIYSLMVDKITGQVAYAVMSFGGFLGMGESYHPLPWRMLKYDVRQNGYVIDIDRRRLEEAPSYNAGPTGRIAPMATGSTRITACRLTVFEAGHQLQSKDKAMEAPPVERHLAATLRGCRGL